MQGPDSLVGLEVAPLSGSERVNSIAHSNCDMVAIQTVAVHDNIFGCRGSCDQLGK
jgi:hypothetical protein